MGESEDGVIELRMGRYYTHQLRPAVNHHVDIQVLLVPGGKGGGWGFGGKLYLYHATKDPILLEMGRDIYTSIETGSNFQ